MRSRLRLGKLLQPKAIPVWAGVAQSAEQGAVLVCIAHRYTVKSCMPLYQRPKITTKYAMFNLHFVLKQLHYFCITTKIVGCQSIHIKNTHIL